VIPLSPGKNFVLLAWYAPGEADTANRPYKLSLVSKYNKYTLERARMGEGVLTKTADQGLLSA